MKVQLSATGVLAAAGIVVAGLVAWRASKAASAAVGAVVDTAREVITVDLNPAADDNIINRQVAAIGRSISGDPRWSVGDAIYDATHTDKADPSRNTVLDTITAPGRALGDWLYNLSH